MLEILYQDEYCVAVHKPSGLFVHRTELAPREPSCMPALRNQIGRWVYPVHRLDRGTSGVLLFALGPEAARALNGLFENRAVEKQYLAVVRGYAPESGRIDYAFCEEEGKGPVEAVTEYALKGTVELPFPVSQYSTARYSLVQAMPSTGRRHQIRRHFAHIFHPVVGDTTHGDGAHNRLFREKFGIGRLLLMATGISFCHPYTGEPIAIRAPLPGKIGRLFERFGWEGVL